MATTTASTHRARTVTRVLLVGVWLVALAYAGLVLLRLVSYDSNRYLAALNAETVWLYLPAYAVASAAWCFRRYALASVATVVVLFQIVAVVPSIGHPAAIPAAARQAPHLRLVTANVRFTNRVPNVLASELLATDADVVVLQELTRRWSDALTDAGFNARYPYVATAQHRLARGLAIYSRRPLEDISILDPYGSPVITAGITVGGATVTLTDVHLVSPAHGMRAHRASLRVVQAAVRQQRTPRIVAGDFNATPYNKTMHDLEDLGLDSAHERRGRGLDATWPNGTHHGVLPVQLDHVLVDDAVVVLDVRELRGSGSDHKPVLVDLAVMPRG